MNGIDCLFEGLAMIRQPGLRRYVAMPLAINILLLAGAFGYGAVHYDAWTQSLTAWLPDWLSFLSWLINLLATLLVILVLLYVFTLVANLIAAPFNAVLSVKVEEKLTGRPPESNTAFHIVMVRSLWREVAKILYYLPRVVGLVIVSLIPGINAAAPLLWVLFGAWMMAVEFTDYGADNNEVSFPTLRRRLGRARWQALGFGVMAYVLLAIPLLNLVLIPAAVAGGTVFWVRNLKDQTIL